MSEFLQCTLTDLRGGRQSWRVVVTLCTPSFLIALSAALARGF